MEKRVIIAFVLSFAVLYAFRAYFQPPSTGERQQTIETQPATSQPVPVAVAPPVVEKTAEAEVPADNLHAEKAEEMAIDTPLYRAVISNVGGVLRSFTLKDYKDGEGRPVELINQTAGGKQGWPLSAQTGDKAIDDALAKAMFVGRREGSSLIFEFCESGL